MKKELIRHIEILKTVPEIKESIEELKLGCWVDYGECEYQFWSKPGDFNYEFFMNDIPFCGTIIGQVEERHLRMFFKTQDKLMTISEDGTITQFIIKSGSLLFGQNGVVVLGDSKPYMEQSEEFFKKLNDWIVKEFKIKL